MEKPVPFPCIEPRRPKKRGNTIMYTRDEETRACTFNHRATKAKKVASTSVRPTIYATDSTFTGCSANNHPATQGGHALPSRRRRASRMTSAEDPI